MRKLLLILSVLLIISSCSKKQEKIKGNADLIYKEAQRQFEKENFEESKSLFETIILQFPASEYADDAQYFIGESEFNQEKYILAAFSYNRLARVYPGSEYVKQSVFKAAECYYELSPNFDRDQEYTKKAIQQFQEFQYQYPADSLTAESNKFIKSLRNKLAEGEYNKAYIYRKLDSPKSSLIYYDEVLEKYDDTDFYELAYFKKIETLVSLRRYDEALGLIDVFKKKFKESEFTEKLKALRDIASNKKQIKDNNFYDDL